MKKYLIFFLFLFSTIMAVNSHNTPQLSDRRLHVADIYDTSDIIHLSDALHYVFYDGELHNYIIYTFTIQSRSTLLMVNMMGTDTDFTGLKLYYRPLNSTRGFVRKRIVYDNHRAKDALDNQDKFGFDFEEDLTQVPLHSPVLYETLEPGEYELYSMGTEDTKKPTQRVTTHIYLSPVGIDQYTSVDVGHFTRNFSQIVKPGTFSGGDIYYKFSLDSMNKVSVVPLDTIGICPVIKLEDYYTGVWSSSTEYPLNEDSLPQIKDFRCGVGEYYIHVYYPDSAYRKPQLQVTGLVDNTGTDWEHPLDAGSYSDSLYYEYFYSPHMFVPSDSYSTSYVYHRFTIKEAMDISIITEEYLNNITLYDSMHRMVKQVGKDDYLTSLDVFGLSPGTYFFVTEGGNRTICIKMKGRKSVQQLPDAKNYVSRTQSIISTPFASDLQGPLSATHEINYLDPFGRTDQTIQYGVTPSLNSLVSRKEYDRMYRDSCSWLPAACPGTDNYVASSDFGKYILELYNDEYACEKSVYDGSPLNRLTAKYNPGRDWHTTGHGEKLSYQTNSGASYVRLFEVTGEKDSPILSQKGFYATGELVVTENKDEAGLSTFTYTNKLEQTILSRTINGADTLDTYQIYDDYGNLSFVLPPMAVSSLQTLGKEKALGLYAYQYRYDGYNHYKGKKLPGEDWIDMCFDQNGKLLRIRDGEMRNRNEWKCTFYDRLGREVVTGIYKGLIKYSSMYVDFAPDMPNSNYGYLFSSYLKMDSLNIQKVTYYDTYDYKMVNSHFTAVMDYTDNNSYGHRYGDDSEQLNCKNLPTGVMTRVVGTEQMLCTSTYYDYYQRPVQVRSTDINGKVHVRNMAYDFSDHITESNDKVENISLVQSKAYDHAGRLLTETRLVNDLVSDTLTYNYDELGRIASIKRVNENHSLTSTNRYNLRGWLTSIESPQFSQKLYYTDGIGTPCYNGNISSITWKTSVDLDIRGYRFEYDLLSRLKNAAYGEGEGLSLNVGRFNEQIMSYDKNGNILGLKRYGQTSANGYGVVDNLAITLNGNQLKKVDDSVSDSAFDNNFEFRDGVRLDTEYFYDTNGNLVKDLNKKITNIQYNYLNLPNRIEFEDGSSISYLYDAAGSKLRVVHCIAGNNTTTTDYCGNVIYENGTPKTLLTDAGFVSLNDNKYHYYFQDHQGNNRVVVSQDGTVEEVNHYYPFGGTFASTSSVQDYKYNGKELDRKGGLDLYDYGARHYDAALGRWHVVDPMAENYYGISPYDYCTNNPVKYIDPSGMVYGDYYSGYSGKFLFSDGIDDNKVYARTTNVVRNELTVKDTYVGVKGDIPDKTKVFNSFLAKTKDYFSKTNQQLEKKESSILMGDMGKYKRKLDVFRKLVTDNAPFDIKVAEGGEFSTRNERAFRNGYAFYDGKLFRYDDFGNFNYGVAGKAFGLSESILKVGAGVNQLSKPNVPHSIFSYGDEDKDNYMIRQGFEYYNKHLK